MFVVTGPGRLPPPSAATRRRPTGPGFTLPGGAPAAAPCQDIASPDLGVASPPSPADTAPDTLARRRGDGLLAALAALQHALLGGDPADALLTEAASLLDGPPATSLALQHALDALGLRVQIEIARRGGLPPLISRTGP